MWYAPRPMKKLLLPVMFALALTLTGCSALGALGQVLMTPLNLLGGMAKAVTRTVTDADTPSDKPISDPVAERGAEIAARGTYGGAVAFRKPAAASGVASR